MIYKGYILKTSPQYPGCVQIAKEGKGGSIPKELSGMFTSNTEAIKLIDAHLTAKGAKRGKASTTS